MKNKILNAFKLINSTIAKIEFVQMSHVEYPNAPKEYTFNDVNNLIANTNRYSRRLLYFARNILNKLNDLIEKLDFNNENNQYIVPVRDDIFFEFDAFIFSCKSILEGSTIEKAKKFDPITKKYFDVLAKKSLETFIKPFLKPLRDEIVHLNNYGTAIGSLLFIEKKENSLVIKLKTNFYKNNKDDIDLIYLFFHIFDNIIEIINKLLGIFIHHYFISWGVPKRNIKYNNLNLEINFDDFDIPGYKGICKI